MEQTAVSAYKEIKTNEDISPTSEVIMNEAVALEILSSNRNEQGLLLASDGSVSHYQNEMYWKISQTESFKKWFEGSKIIYEDNNEPLIVFHSTLKKKFEGINLKENQESDDWHGFGIYFSSDRDATIDYFKDEYEDTKRRFAKLLARDYGEKKTIAIDKKKYFKEHEGQVKTFAAFIRLKNPLELDNHQQLMNLSFSGVKQSDLLKTRDGIVVNYDFNFENQYVVFRPEDILMLPSEIA